MEDRSLPDYEEGVYFVWSALSRCAARHQRLHEESYNYLVFQENLMEEYPAFLNVSRVSVHRLVIGNTHECKRSV